MTTRIPAGIGEPRTVANRIGGQMEDEQAPIRPVEQDAPSDNERRLESDARRLRVAAGALAATLAATMLWVLFQGINGELVLDLMVFGALVATACILTFCVAQLLIDEPLSEVVRVILGEPLAVRNNDRFLRRLTHECTDSQMRSRYRTFSLVVIGTQQVDGEREAPVTHLREAVRSSIRSRDVMGQVGSHELWVLALGADAEAAGALSRRLADRTGIRPDEVDQRAARYRASIFNPDETEEAAAA